MTHSDSDRIKDFFAVRSRYLTPVPVRHAVHVLYAPVSYDPEVTELARQFFRWLRQGLLKGRVVWQTCGLSYNSGVSRKPR